MRLLRLAPADGFDHRMNAPRDQVLALLPFLTENQGTADVLAATVNARLAAPLIIATGAKVIAFGGFLGTMPVMDQAGLARLAADGALRFVVLEQAGTRRGPARDTETVRWVRAHGVQRDLAAIAPGLEQSRLEVYDLRPDLPVN